MKLSTLIETLQAIHRRHGNIDVILYDGDNEEFDIDHVDTGWSRTFQHTYAVICTGNHEEGSEPQEESDPLERDESRLYERGELPARDSRDEHDKTLGPAYE